MNASAKLLHVLEAVTDGSGEHRLSAIVASTGLAKTSVHRLLGELVANGYVARDGEGIYRASTGLEMLAAKVRRSDASMGMRRILATLQERVAQTIHFALRSGDSMVYVEKVEGAQQQIRMASMPGKRVSLHSCGLGKAVLGQLPEREVRRYAKRSGLPPTTDHTITDLQSLLGDLARVREQGYALDDEENEYQIRCIAAAVFNAEREPVGAVSISTVAALVPFETLQGFAGALIGTAEELGRELDR